MLIARFRSFTSDSYLQLAWLMTIVGALERGLLLEPDHRGSGNWSWGYHIALNPLFLYSVAELLRWSKAASWNDRRQMGLLIGAYALLGLHVWNGLLYVKEYTFG